MTQDIPFSQVSISKIKHIISNFNKISKKNTKPNNTTHFIQYIFTQNDLEFGTYRDIYHLLYSNVHNKNCIFDLMFITMSEANFLHIDKNGYNIKTFDKKKFFSKQMFSKFIKHVVSVQKNYSNINSIFVFGGHCDGWYCYCEDVVIDFNMIRQTFIDNNLLFDLICFDSCYTSSIEIIYQFFDLTDYIIAHQTYIGIEGFNSVNLCKIFDSNLSFRDKLIIASVDFIKRSKSEKEPASNTIVDCTLMRKFFKLLNKNFSLLKKLIKTNNKKLITDPCEEWLAYCKSKYSPQSRHCGTQYCSNMLDLFGLIKNSNLPDKTKLLELFNCAVHFMTNGIPLDPKYFKHKEKFHGINIIIDPKKSELGKHYETLKFYKDFYNK